MTRFIPTLASEINSSISNRRHLVLVHMDRTLTHEDMFHLMYPPDMHLQMRKLCPMVGKFGTVRFSVGRASVGVNHFYECESGYPVPIAFDREHWPQNDKAQAVRDKIAHIDAQITKVKKDWQKVADTFDTLNNSGMSKQEMCNFWPALLQLMQWSESKDLKAMIPLYDNWRAPKAYNRLPTGFTVDLKETNAIVGATVFLDPDAPYPSRPAYVDF